MRRPVYLPPACMGTLERKLDAESSCSSVSKSGASLAMVLVFLAILPSGPMPVCEELLEGAPPLGRVPALANVQ